MLPVRVSNQEITEEGIRYAIQNEKIKGLYVIPDYQNPTAHIMSLETRKMIAKAAGEEKLLVIEDGINNLLAENPIPPIAAFAPEQVIYISSLSKTVSPGEPTAPLRYVRLPEYFTGKSFEICAGQAGVEVYGAERFCVGNGIPEKAVRISVITPPSLEILTEGLNRLKALLK